MAKKKLKKKRYLTPEQIDALIELLEKWEKEKNASKGNGSN